MVADAGGAIDGGTNDACGVAEDRAVSWEGALGTAFAAGEELGPRLAAGEAQAITAATSQATDKALRQVSMRPRISVFSSASVVLPMTRVGARCHKRSSYSKKDT